VNDLVLSRTGSRLFAFTHGRGVFYTDRTNFTVTPTLTPTGTPPTATPTRTPTLTTTPANTPTITLTPVPGTGCGSYTLGSPASGATPVTRTAGLHPQLDYAGSSTAGAGRLSTEAATASTLIKCEDFQSTLTSDLLWDTFDN